MAKRIEIQEETYNKLLDHVWEIASEELPHWYHITEDGWWQVITPITTYYRDSGNRKDLKIFLCIGDLDYDDPDAIYWDEDGDLRYKTSWSKRKVVTMTQLIDAYLSLLQFEIGEIAVPDTDTLLQKALLGEIKYG